MFGVDACSIEIEEIIFAQQDLGVTLPAGKSDRSLTRIVRGSQVGNTETDLVVVSRAAIGEEVGSADPRFVIGFGFESSGQGTRLLDDERTIEDEELLLRYGRLAS